MLHVDLRRRWIFVPLAGMIFACAAHGWGQTEPCGLRHHTEITNQENRSGFLPWMDGAFADAEVAGPLEAGYRALYFRRRIPAAEKSLHTALDRAESRKSLCGEGLAAFALGIAAQQNDVTSAASWLHRAEAAFQQAHAQTGVARTHFALASVGIKTRSPAENHAAFTAVALEMEQAGEPVDALAARMEAIIPTDNDAEAQFAHLADEAHALHALDLEARDLHLWGDAEYSRAKYDGAMLHYRQSDALYAACRCDPNQRAYVQTSMGRLERSQGRPQTAIEHYRVALRLQAQGHDRAYMPQTLNAISVAYEAMHRYATAIVYLKRALADAHAIHSRQFIDFLEPSLGYLYFQAGQPRRGLPLLEHAVAHMTADYRQCNRYDQLSEIYLSLGETGNAEDRITRAVAACGSAKDDRGLSNALETRARIRLQRNELNGALDDAQRSLALVEQIRSHLVPEDAHKRGYNEKTLNLYETCIAVLARMNRFPEALEVTEQARARAFLDLLSSPHAPVRVGGAQTSVRGNVALVKASGTRGGRDSSGMSRDPLIASQSHVPSMHTAEMAAMAEHLHTTLLAYWISNDTLYVWVVRPGHPVYGVARAVKAGEIEALVRAINPFEGPDTATRGLKTERMKTRGGQTMGIDESHRETWKKLYRFLIKPIEAELPQEPGSLLTIVPYGPLFQLPFAALVDGQNRYLVERYALDTVPAVGLLAYTKKNEEAALKLPPHYLFVANPQHFPRLPHSESLPALPGTGAEVKAIASTLPADEVTLLEGDDADLSHLIGALPEATVLHFATHAIVSDSDPFGSFLALDHDPASNQSGLLTTPSIYEMHLHTLMVVLSACRTGRGPISGDGVAGLSRAFFYAGSASVLTTMWDVADAPTSLLMPLFYRNLEQGESRSAALRNAQLALIGQLRRHRVKVEAAGKMIALPERPAFWAAFSLSGQP